MTTEADARRIKRQLHAQPQTLKIHCGRGLRGIAKAELQRLLDNAAQSHKFPPCIDPEGVDQGGAIVVANIGFRNALELALRCSTAKEILLDVGSGRADTAKNAQKVLKNVPWSFLLKDGECIALRVSSLRSRLFHERAFKETAAKMLTGLGYDIKGQEAARTIIDLRLVDNSLNIAISIPGAHLPHRGYKAALKALAPMREDLAAAGVEAARLLALAVHGDAWRPSRIVAPFAGSGTLGFEATRGFLKVAPGLFRDDWAFLDAPCAPAKTVTHVLDALRERVDAAALSSPIVFIENDAAVCAGLRLNCASFNARLVAQGIPAIAFDILEQDVFTVETASWGGQSLFIAINPPYGIRLEDRGSAQKTYKKLGTWIAALGKCGPVTGYIFGREDDLALVSKSLAKQFRTDVIPFVNGGLKLGILTFTVFSPAGTAT